VTPSTLLSEPPCPAPDHGATAPSRAATAAIGSLHADRRNVRDIPRDAWDRLASLTPWATPFSGWAFQRAWWDAYGENATEETLLVCSDGTAGIEPIGIVALMHRHEVDPRDALTHTTMRHEAGADLTPVEPTATAVFFGASYHADYATILGAPADFPAIATALVDHVVATGGRHGWDAVDLRRLRCGDPAADALAAAFGAREIAEGWTLNVEREDVCPVVHLAAGASMDDYLATLGKKERHEIRRKVRRAEAIGPIRLEDSPDAVADLEAFIDLHQKRWGIDGLFPDTPGGEQSRVFFRRLFELAGAEGPRLTFLTVGGRRIAAGVHFETPDGFLYYNAGVDPDARELSPGVVMVYAYMERALAAGKRRVDFMRGNEPYKYEWGAEDEPIQRILVRRRNG
jgi:CelD/BcsL family acetyltransferase involved in cellulose biosynthesis